MVYELIRESAFGQIVRLITRNKVFQYPEEKDLSFYEKYINHDKSRNMAVHGSTEPPEDFEKKHAAKSPQDPESSTSTIADNEASRYPTDPEKGRDVTMIDWYGPDDPEVDMPILIK